MKGDHNFCLLHEHTDYIWEYGIEHPEVSAKLDEIINYRSSDFDKVTKGASTQANESFHQTQLKFGDKRCRFPASQEIRDNFAIRSWNESEAFDTEMRKRLHLPDLDPKQEAIHFE